MKMPAQPDDEMFNLGKDGQWTVTGKKIRPIAIAPMSPAPDGEIAVNVFGTICAADSCPPAVFLRMRKRPMTAHSSILRAW
jgi:hypothetical protein